MMAAVGRGSNPEEEGGAGQETPPNVMGQPESHDLTLEIEVLGEAMPPKDTSEVEVLGEARGDEVGVAVGPRSVGPKVHHSSCDDIYLCSYNTNNLVLFKFQVCIKILDDV